MPIFIKVSPDIKDSSVEKISEIIINQKVQGVILTNTTNINPYIIIRTIPIEVIYLVWIPSQ